MQLVDKDNKCKPFAEEAKGDESYPLFINGSADALPTPSLDMLHFTPLSYTFSFLRFHVHLHLDGPKL